MELALMGFNPCCIGLSAEAQTPAPLASAFQCFNPCCIGLSAEASLPRQVVHPWRCFNPCCIGLSAEARRNGADGRKTWRFQSLLYWIKRWGRFRGGRWWKTIESFNPCCIGLSAEAASNPTVRTPTETFQSLLYWIKRWGIRGLLFSSSPQVVSILVVLD